MADGKYLREVCGVARTLVHKLTNLRGLLFRGGELCAEQDGVSPSLVAYLVDGTLQGGIACAVAFIEKDGNDRALGDDTGEDDPRFLEQWIQTSKICLKWIFFSS